MSLGARLAKLRQCWCLFSASMPGLLGELPQTAREKGIKCGEIKLKNNCKAAAIISSYSGVELS